MPARSLWPPGIHTILAGAPLAVTPASLASAWSRSNRVSLSPWISRVGTLMRAITLAGLEAAMSARALGGATPVSAVAT
jgi:hypothetical protein